MKNLALVTLGSSPGSGVAKKKKKRKKKKFNVNTDDTRNSKVCLNIDEPGALGKEQTFIWYGVASIFREVVFNFGFSS